MSRSSLGGLVFISYSRRDNVAMLRIVSFLRKQGIHAWVDNEKLVPGTPIWEEEIEKAIKAASAIVVVLSPDAKNSEWVRREISLADQYRKRVFPVLVRGDEETSISLRLIGRQFVDVRDKENDGLVSLTNALSAYLEELSVQEQQAWKAQQEKIDKEKREVNEKKLQEKELLDVDQPSKAESPRRIFADRISHVGRIVRRLNVSPRNIVIGIGAISITVLLVIWGISSRTAQTAKDAFINLTVVPTDLPTFQQTMGATTPTLEQATATSTITVTPTTLPHSTGERVKGVTVTYWDAEVDWGKVKNAGIQFAAILATEGTSHTDATFDENWKGSKSVGILRSPVHFFRANIDPVAQAEYFIRTVEAMGDTGELPPILDLETNDGESKEKVIAKVKTWLDLVEQGLGRRPIIYSGQYLLRDYFSETGGGPPIWAVDYPLWLAQYPNEYVNGMEPFLPSGWSNWTFWQYTDKGTIDGINAGAYINIFNGSIEDLYRFSENR